jgi:hypothetical protein
MTWMAVGPVSAIALLFLIGTGSRAELSSYDLALALAVMVAVIARWVDIAHFRGDTAEGQPATMRHFGSYSLRLVVGVGAIWALVHGSALL